MGFIRDNTNTFQVCLTDLGKQKFFDGGFKDAISFFSISDGDSNYDMFDPSLNEIIPFNDKAVINIGDVVRFDSYAPINNNSIYNIIDTTTDNFEINEGTGLTEIGFGFDGFNYPITIALQPDGKILAGGGFTTYSGVTRNGIVRLNPNGTIDNTFNIGTGFTNGRTVWSIALQPDGKILVGGSFSTYSGVTRNRIIRLNTGGTIDNTFNIGTGFSGGTGSLSISSGTVSTIAVQPDGKILVGGDFSSYSGVTRNGIIRLNSDGTIDNTFSIGGGFGGFLYSIALQPDGKILAAGGFTSYNSVSSNFIIRLNTGGTIDNTFDTGTFTTPFSGFNSFVRTITLQPDGKILAGGNFTSYSGVTSNNIIRLNTGGTIDNTFNVSSGFSGFNDVYSIAVQPDGKILAGGDFTSYNGIVYNGIIRLNSDATIDATFNIGTGFGTGVGSGSNVLKLQPDGKILAAGDFTSYNNTNMAGIIRLNIDGSVDKIENIVTRYFRNIKEFFNKNQLPFFNSSLITNNEYWEETFPFDSTNINPQTIQTLNHNGVKKTSLPLNILKENDYSINRTITITSLSNYNSMLNGTILVGDSIGNNGKYFETIHLQYIENTTLRKSVIIASEGTKVYSDYKLGVIGNGAKIGVDIYIDIIEKQIILDEGVFNCLIIEPYYEDTWENDPQNISPTDNHVSYITGGTTQLRFNFGENVKPEYPQKFKAFEILNNDILPVGDNIIRLNTGGTIDKTFNIGTGFTNGSNVYTIVSQPDNKILVGGDFTSYSGVTSNRIIRLNTGGTIDNTFNIGTGFNALNDIVFSIVPQLDGKILVGGTFTSYSGVTSNRIIRLNTGGTIDNTFNIGGGFSGGSVYSIALQPDGKILVGGTFTSYSGVTSNRIIRLNTGGTIDNTFNISSGFGGNVSTIALQPDGKILVGGDFGTYSGVTSNFIIRLNTGGTIDNTFNIGTGFNFPVYSIVLQPDGKILAGGDFTSYSGVTSNRIIRLNTGGTIDNTFNISSGFGGGRVQSMTLQPDGKILVGGQFTTYNGVTSDRIIRLNTGGTIDNTFNIGTGFGDTTTPIVYSIVLQPDGKILAGGDFTSYSSLADNAIINITTPLGFTTSFNIDSSDTSTPTGNPALDKLRFFRLNAPYPPQLNSISGDTLVVDFDYFIPDFTLIQNSAINNFKIESNIQINTINDIFVQTTLRGDIVENKAYRYALFGVKNKTQKSYVLFEPDFNSNDTLSILTYLINE
jgi:uncharacterized delta-60 repeat protein